MSVTVFADEAFPEGGTRTPQVSFKDEENNYVVPSAASYSLYQLSPDPTETPTVINSLLNEDATANIDQNSDGTVTLDIVLSGDDLSFLASETGVHAKRVLVVKYTYDSNIGSNLIDYVRFIFTVERVEGV